LIKKNIQNGKKKLLIYQEIILHKFDLIILKKSVMTKKIYNLNEFKDNSNFFFEEAKIGKIFVYPTDTIY
jgi:hypothetical protein